MSGLLHVISIVPQGLHAALVASCLLLAGCGPTPPRNGQTTDDTALITSFFKQYPDQGDLFLQPLQRDEVDFLFDVYVDHSASIKGYLNLQSLTAKKGTSGNVAPNFFNLLRQLANRGELLGFNAFGTVGRDAHSTEENITPLGRVAPTTSDAYNRLNNDYSSLIQKIKSEQMQESDGKPVQHIIITDGVQSHRDPGNGSALNKTVKELQAWIDAGGAVDIRVSVSAFAGKYYSEELRALQRDHSFSGNVTDRPFLIISLLQSPAHLPSWQKFWNTSGLATIPIEAEASFPRPIPENVGFVMKPEAEVDKALAPEMLFSKIWEMREVVTIENASNLFASQILRPQDLKNQIAAKYPICVSIKGSGSELVKDFKASKPALRIWRRAPSIAQANTAESAAKQQVVEAPASDWRELAKEEMAGLPTDLRETFSADPSPLSETESGPRLLIRAPLQSRGTDHILVLTTEHTPAPPAPLDFSQFSCTDDSTPESLSRIYNLQQLIEQFSHGMKPISRRSSLLILTHY